jgi:hypothetical protein
VSITAEYPKGVLPFIGTLPSGRRYLRIDAILLASQFDVSVDALWKANKLKRLHLTYQRCESSDNTQHTTLRFELDGIAVLVPLRIPISGGAADAPSD